MEVNEVVKEQAAKESVREQGLVKFFDEAKGWGFITRPDTSELFVHFTSIQAEGFKTLHDGQVVSYTPVHTKKGMGRSGSRSSVMRVRL